MVEDSTAYPMSLVINYHDRKLSGLTIFLSPPTAISIIIILGLISNAALFGDGDGRRNSIAG